MAKEYRADVFSDDYTHVKREFDTESEAIAFIDGAKEFHAKAGFLLKYAHTTFDGVDMYDVVREIFFRV